MVKIRKIKVAVLAFSLYVNVSTLMLTLLRGTGTETLQLLEKEKKMK